MLEVDVLSRGVGFQIGAVSEEGIVTGLGLLAPVRPSARSPARLHHRADLVGMPGKTG